jgi:YgiT-type zinc finger domain-containing protein
MHGKHTLFGVPLTKICHNCGSVLKTDKTDLKEKRAGQIFILENVPIYTCKNCQETWIPAVILNEFKKHTKLRSVKYGRREKQN